MNRNVPPRFPYRFPIFILKVTCFTAVAYALVFYTPLVSLVINYVLTRDVLAKYFGIVSGNLAGFMMGSLICHLVPDPWSSYNSTLYQRANNDYIAPFFALHMLSSSPICAVAIWISKFVFISPDGGSELMFGWFAWKVFLGCFVYSCGGVVAVPVFFC